MLRDRLLILAFVAAISIPGLATLYGVDQNLTSAENRTLAPAPELNASWTSVKAFPDAFTKFFEDHFAFRARLVSLQSALRLRWFGISPTPAVIAGKDGWFFYADDGGIEDYASHSLLSAEDLETWRDALQSTQDWLHEQGITYLFVVAPDKTQIYPEAMPASIHRVHYETRIDQLVNYLRTHSTVHVLDLRPALLAAKAQERLYHRTDTHWNDRGAYVAYQQIMAQLGSAHLTPVRPRGAFTERDTVIAGMDLARMMGLDAVLTETALELVPKTPDRVKIVEPPNGQRHGMYSRFVTEQDDRTLPRAVVFRDSFMSAVIPFFSEHFSRALYLWEPDVDPAVVAAERPSVVIEEWVGRHLVTKLPYNSVAALRQEGQLPPVRTGVTARAAGD